MYYLYTGKPRIMSIGEIVELQAYDVFQVLSSFRLDYEYEIEHEYDFSIFKRLTFLEPHVPTRKNSQIRV